MFGYIINSTFRYFQKSLPRLITSMIKSGIMSKDIFVYVSGSPKAKRELFLGCNIVFVEHNSYDFTSFIEMSNNPIDGYDYFFYLHDTCEVDENFKDIVEKKFMAECDVMYVSSKNVGVSNLGMYSKKIIVERKDFVSLFLNCSKNDAVLNESKLIKSIENKKPYPNENIDTFVISDVYGDGVKRLTENYKHIGLKKYKANWYGKHKDDWEINL